MAIREECTFCRLFGQRCHHLGMGMTQQERCAAHGVVDVLLAVDFPFPRPFGALDVFRVWSLEATFVGHAARQTFAGLLKQFFRRLRHDTSSKLRRHCLYSNLIEVTQRTNGTAKI